MAYNIAPSKQDTLVSGTNIKTINSNSILGSGNLTVAGLPTSTNPTDADKVVAVDSAGTASWQYAGLGGGAFPSNTVILGRGVPSGMTATSGILIGTGSNLGTGASQVIIGASSGRSTTGATGANNTVVGSGSFNAAGLTSAANNVIIGQGNGIAITTHSGGVFIGKDCAKAITTGGGTGGNGNVAIGQNALSAAVASTGGIVAIGDDAATNAAINNYTTLVGSVAGNGQIVGGNAVCIGHRASSSGNNGTAIGTSATNATFDNCVAVGNNAQNTGNQSIALGRSTLAAANYFVAGSSNCVINTVVFGRGWDNSVSVANSPLTITNTRVNSGYTNVDGSLGTLTITPSNSTGSGTGGDFIVSTAGTGSSGTTANAYVERLRIKALTEVVVNDTGVDFDFRVEGDTDANLLFVDAGTDRVGVGNNAPAVKLHTQATTAATNTVTNVLRVDSQSSGTPANGIGVGIEMAAETAVGNTEIGVVLEAVTTDVTSTSEDFDLVVKNMAAGATAAETLRVASTGDVTAKTGNILIDTAGKGLTVKSGSNAKIGVTGAFPGGNPNTVTVSNTSVTSNSIILVSAMSFTGGLTNAPYVSAITASTSFVITVPDNSFTGTVGWVIVEQS